MSKSNSELASQNAKKVNVNGTEIVLYDEERVVWTFLNDDGAYETEKAAKEARKANFGPLYGEAELDRFPIEQEIWCNDTFVCDIGDRLVVIVYNQINDLDCPDWVDGFGFCERNENGNWADKDTGRVLNDYETHTIEEMVVGDEWFSLVKAVPFEIEYDDLWEMDNDYFCDFGSERTTEVFNNIKDKVELRELLRDLVGDIESEYDLRCKCESSFDNLDFSYIYSNDEWCDNEDTYVDQIYEDRVIINTDVFVKFQIVNANGKPKIENKVVW